MFPVPISSPDPSSELRLREASKTGSRSCGQDAYKWQSGREASQWKSRCAVPGSELLRGRTVLGHEQREALVEDLANALPEGTKVGRRRLLQFLGPGAGFCWRTASGPQHPFSGLNPFCPSFGDDLLGEASDLVPIVLPGELFPAGQWSEMPGLGVGIVVFRVGPPGMAQGILASPVVPEAFGLVPPVRRRLALDETAGTLCGTPCGIA
jgi:hypothetical protein